jgi:hypothetical protein
VPKLCRSETTATELPALLQGVEHPSTADLNRLLQDIRTALEIHAFDSDGEEAGMDLGPDSIEGRFPSMLPTASPNSPIPSPPASREVVTGL